MAELKVILTNESGGGSSPSSGEPTTTTGQQKIEQAKVQNASGDRAKSVMTATLSVAQSGLNLYQHYSSIQNSLEGNSAYSQMVAKNVTYLQKGLSIGGSFLMGTAMSGGNVAIGGAAAIISAVTSVANDVIDVYGQIESNKIAQSMTNITRTRLGSSNNIWRK